MEKSNMARAQLSKDRQDLKKKRIQIHKYRIRLARKFFWNDKK